MINVDNEQMHIHVLETHCATFLIQNTVCLFGYTLKSTLVSDVVKLLSNQQNLCTMYPVTIFVEYTLLVTNDDNADNNNVKFIL